MQFFCVIEPKNIRNSFGDRITRLSYFYFLLKIVDLLDTIFFIMRKKNNQVTFLHVYHHAGMLMGGYVYLKLYSGGGVASFLGEILNLLINEDDLKK